MYVSMSDDKTATTVTRRCMSFKSLLMIVLLNSYKTYVCQLKAC